MNTFSLDTVIIVALVAFIIGIFVGVYLTNQSFKAWKERETQLSKPSIPSDFLNEKIQIPKNLLQPDRTSLEPKTPEIKRPMIKDPIIFTREDEKKSK